MLEYWLWLAHRPNLNDHQKLQLLQSFQTPQGVYQAEPGDFDAFPTITGQGKIALAEKDLSPYQKVLEYCQREQIRILTIFDPAYPRRLFNIYDPPPQKHRLRTGDRHAAGAGNQPVRRHGGVWIGSRY